MRSRATIKAAIAATVLALVGASTAAASNAGGRAAIDPHEPTIDCIWGGTPVNPTGRFTLTPGLTHFPSSRPLKLDVTGELSGSGRCQGTMVFKGIAKTGATCDVVEFVGRVKGVPGVASFWGGVVGGVAQEFLYDRKGRIVGSDQPQVLTNADHFSDCFTQKGLTAGNFSSTVQFYENPIEPDPVLDEGRRLESLLP
jgi:hypothetical protein